MLPAQQNLFEGAQSSLAESQFIILYIFDSKERERETEREREGERERGRERIRG